MDLITSILGETRIKTKFEEIFSNQGFNTITENILINLDVKSLWRCRLVCKALYQFIKSLEKSIKLKKNDLKLIRRIRRKQFLIHSNWNAAFNLICQEDNFYRRRGLLELLETYEKQDRILETNGCWSDTRAQCPIIGSYLNTSKLLNKNVTSFQFHSFYTKLKKSKQYQIKRSKFCNKKTCLTKVFHW